MDEAGFSMDQKAPAWASKPHHLMVRVMNRVPRRTFSLSAASSPGTPNKCWSVRRGGGPPSPALRAREKVVHGVPKWTNFTQPELSQASTFEHSAGSQTSAAARTSPSITMSMGGRTFHPRFLIALVSQALPENTSRNQGLASISAVGTAGTCA